MKNIFRALVVISFVSFLLAAYWPLVGPSFLVEGHDPLVLADGHKAIYQMSIPVHIVIFSLWLFVFSGMFFFIKIARTLFILLLIFDFLTIPFLGYVVMVPSQAFFMSIVTVIDGAIIVLAYLTSVSKEFNNVS